MPGISLATNDWSSQTESVPRLKLRNMYIAEDPMTPDGRTYLSRMTLQPYAVMDTSNCYGAFTLDGTFSTGLSQLALVVYGTVLYMLDIQSGAVFTLGAIPGTGYCQFAATSSRVLIVRNGSVYSVDGTAVTTVVIPDGLSIGSVAAINGYFILTVQNSNKFFWINPGGTNPDALDFASAERYPDPIISVNVINDEIWFLGSKGPEVWQATGSSDAPFTRIAARDYNEGCLSRSTAIGVTYNNFPALMWVTSSGAVTLAQGAPKKVSNESVEELMRKVLVPSLLRAYSFRYNRHDFYVLSYSIPDDGNAFTLVYDLTVGNWCRWDSEGQTGWKGQLGFQIQTDAYVCESDGPNVYKLVDGGVDDTGDVVRELSGTVLNQGHSYPCNDVIVSVNGGFNSDEPLLDMRFSDDRGKTWSEYISASTGLSGTYDKEVIYRSLGLIKRPGRVFEFRYSGNCRIRIDYATINEAST